MDRANGGVDNGQKSGWGSYNNGSAARSNSEQQSQQSTGVIQTTGGNAAVDGSNAPQAALAEIERQVVSMKQDFTSSLHKVGEKENEKFDLIFAILSELQGRQAVLEESVRSLKAQFGGCGNPNGQAGMMSGSPTNGGCQFNMASNGQNFNAQSMGGGNAMSNGQQMNGGMAGGNMMQSCSGVMSADGSQMYPMAQMVVMNSPTGGMQYAMPQVMTPNGSMQAMAPQMAMQYMAQGDMNSGSVGFVAGSQDGGCMAMPIRPSGTGQGEWSASDEKHGSVAIEDDSGANASSGGQEPHDSLQNGKS